MNVASVSLDVVLRPRHGCSASMTARPFLPPQQSASSSWPMLQVSVRRAQAQVAATSFLALFAIVGLALYGLPFFYDFMVRDFGWSRAQVTSGNALSKLLVGPLFGFLAGWMVDRFGPRRLMVAGILMAGIAPVGLGMIHTLDRPPIGPVLGAPAFYLLLVGSMCSIAAVGGTNQHLKLFLSLDHGYSQAGAAQIASLVLASSLVGRLGAGWLADRFAKKYVMLLIYSLVVSGIPLLLLTGARGTIYLFAVVFGLGLGGEYMVIPLMAGELFGVRVLGRTMGVVLTGDGIAEAVAPGVVGRMHDASGSYTNGFLALIGCALTGAIAVALLPRGVRP